MSKIPQNILDALQDLEEMAGSDEVEYVEIMSEIIELCETRSMNCINKYLADKWKSKFLLPTCAEQNCNRHVEEPHHTKCYYHD